MTAHIEGTETAAVDNDAREFGKHFKQGGWRLGLLVARNVYMSDGERGRSDLEAAKLGKVTANQFADKAGVTPRTVQLYYRAWGLAADNDECQHAAALSPGGEDGNVNFDEDDDEMREKWSVYYRKAKGLKNTQPQEHPSSESEASAAKARTPEARISIAIKSIAGIDVGAAEDPATLGQQLQDARKSICELIDQQIERIETPQPANLN